MSKPQFTQEQQDYICYQIGEWYLDWKNKMVVDGGQHRLGFAKELLKTMIVGDGSKEIVYKAFTIHIYEESKGFHYELRYNALNMMLYRDICTYELEHEVIEAAKKKVDELNGGL